MVLLHRIRLRGRESLAMVQARSFYINQIARSFVQRAFKVGVTSQFGTQTRSSITSRVDRDPEHVVYVARSARRFPDHQKSNVCTMFLFAVGKIFV